LSSSSSFFFIRALRRPSFERLADAGDLPSGLLSANLRGPSRWSAALRFPLRKASHRGPSMPRDVDQCYARSIRVLNGTKSGEIEADRSP
jgi:hypothetical protein